jgi:very-short-patch-repair endonuclease
MQQRFSGLEYDGPLRCDFYLTDKKVVIEYNGQQHYKVIKFFGGKEGLKNTQARDLVKKMWCKRNSIGFEIIRYDESIEERLIEILKIEK